jgi:phosphatidylserine/phosphatidylglycerophosphate/cardiolipin synthase-like enzyme
LRRLLQVLGSAKRTLDVCVFTITCDEIADALIQAHQRGVRVRVISDNDQVRLRAGRQEGGLVQFTSRASAAVPQR